MTNAIFDGGDATTRPLLVCMLPARNAARDLPDYLACVDRFCDAIVALDDGSTDETYDILAAHPSVKILLRNPVRGDYRGWDDAANRNRLLEAVEALNPEWLISLDADERIDARDAASLRDFLQTDALPGFAYGFRVVPMRHDGEHFIPVYLWVQRLFSYTPGQRFPRQKLHFKPIPSSIPPYRWLKTNIRIQHLGELNENDRLTRFNKYLEADPLRTYQASYAPVLDVPDTGEVRRWIPRPKSVPVLAEAGLDDPPEPDPESGTPAMSVIVVSQDTGEMIGDTLASVTSQEVSEPFEIIVVSGADRIAEMVRSTFPDGTVIELSGGASPGEARNAGLAVARGQFIVFVGSDVELQPGSIAARLRAHRRGYAMVATVVTNGTTTPAGWATHFLDHPEALPGHAAGEIDGPSGLCSYASLPLLEVGAFPEGRQTAGETEVNRALVKRGYVAYREPAAGYIRRSRCETIPQLLRHQFQQGRHTGRLLLTDNRQQGHMLNAAMLRTHLIDAVPQRLARIHRSAMLANPEIIAEYTRVRLLITLGAIASWAGTWFEVLRPARGKLAILLGRPVVNVLLVGGEPGALRLALAQVNEVSGRVTMRSLSPDLTVPHDGSARSLVALLDASPGMEGFRREIGEALDLEHLECVIDPALDLGYRPSPEMRDLPPILSPAGGMDRVVEIAGMFTALALGRRRSTMSAWGTARLLSRLRPFRQGH